MINVIIADDDEIFRNGLKVIIEQDKDIKVCGLASNGNSAYDLCKTESPTLYLWICKCRIVTAQVLLIK